MTANEVMANEFQF